MPRIKNEFMIFDSTRLCPVCQKGFVANDDSWAYKAWLDRRHMKKVWFCSGKCFRKWENGEVTLSGRGMRLSEKKKKIWQALDDGLSISEICKLLDVTVGSVKYYKSKWVPKED